MYLLIIGFFFIILSLILDICISRIQKRKKDYIETSLQQKRKHSVTGERISVEVPDSISQVSNVSSFRVLGLIFFVLGVLINLMVVFNMLRESILL